MSNSNTTTAELAAHYQAMAEDDGPASNLLPRWRAILDGHRRMALAGTKDQILRGMLIAARDCAITAACLPAKGPEDLRAKREMRQHYAEFGGSSLVARMIDVAIAADAEVLEAAGRQG